MMDKSEAVASLEKPSSEISQATSSNAGTPQGESVQIYAEEPRPIEVVVSSSEICQATSRLNPRTSQGEDPSPSATNGRERTLDESRALCGPLLQAAIKGDWPDAKAFLDINQDCVGAPITKEEATALHVAVNAQRTTFITELLKLMSPDDLMKLKTNYGFTALHSAAQVGNVRIAQQLLEMNQEPLSGIVRIAEQPVKIDPAPLLMIADNDGQVPLNVAAYQGHANMVRYLLPLTPLKQLTEKNRIELLAYTIDNDLYDMALEILREDPLIPNIYIAIADATCGSRVLKILARKPFAIGSESELSFWKSLLNSWFKGICNKALMKTLAHQLVVLLWKKVGIPDKQFPSKLAHSEMITLIFEAAKVGNVEFLIILTRFYPDLLWQVDQNNTSLFHIAIKHRHQSVFNLIYEIGAQSLATYANSDTNDNMLHLAGKLAPPDRLNIVSGAALQMQQELLWFKEIEKIVPPSYMNIENKKGDTPKQIFIDNHKKLQQDGEKWMKDTANYCMLVATLIATVIFAAIITVPGDSNQERSSPIFLRRTWFMVFFISNATALCSSSTSIVIFLSILTSRYTEEDFLKSLPLKLAFGLATLFISIMGMMVAFSATCVLVFSNVRAWAHVVVITSASLPVTLFFLLHRKLWVDAFFSTCTSRFLFHPCKQRLFQRKMPIGELS